MQHRPRRARVERPTDRPAIYPGDVVVMAVVPVNQDATEEFNGTGRIALHFWGWHRKYLGSSIDATSQTVPQADTRSLVHRHHEQALPYLGCRSQNTIDTLVYLYNSCSSRKLDASELMWKREMDMGTGSALSSVSQIFNDDSTFHFFFPTERIGDQYQLKRWALWHTWGDPDVTQHDDMPLSKIKVK